MSAGEKERVAPERGVQKLGILAGGGELPHILLEACDACGIEVFIVAFEGQTDPLLTLERPHMLCKLGAVGSVLKTLKNHDIQDICLIGKMRRPSLAELRPDMKAAKFLATSGFKALGDDGLLRALKGFLQDEGLRVHGVQEFASGLLTPHGAIGARKPGADERADIARGMEILQKMSGLDIGQAVIVQEGIVLGVEAVEGTDALIERCGPLHRKGRGGVLVKLCKQGQDRDLDLPTIGPRTVELAVRHGLSGIAVHAGQSLLLKKQEVAQIADRHKIFVTGIDA